MGNRTVIEGERLAVGYRQRGRVTEVLRGLDFGLRGGGLTCLLGRNGAGKSTLLRTLAGMQPPLCGRLELMGKPSGAYGARERSRAVCVVFTDRTQAGGLSVYEIVALGRQPYTGFFGRLSPGDKTLIWRALKEVGMAEKAHCRMAELSDGERQKAMIAKALVQECPLILLDEPTAFLDVESRMEVTRLLRRLAVEDGKAVLLSTHDVEQALAMSDRLWLLEPGGAMLCGETEDLVLSGAMDGLFGGAAVRFDTVRGVYAPEDRSSRVVRLEAADEASRYWARNFLVRHGFRAVARDEGAEGTPLLAVSGPRDMAWTRGGVSSRFRSFAALAEVLEARG